MFKKAFLSILCLFSASLTYPRAIIDLDIEASLHNAQLKTLSSKTSPRLAAIIFLQSTEKADSIIADLEHLPGILVKKFESIPAVLVQFPADQSMLQTIASHPAAMQISSLHGGHEELEYSEQAVLLRPSTASPEIHNWWDNGYTGKNSIIGLIDSGVASEHPSLSQIELVVRKELGSGYTQLKNGVRTPHGTGVACIYAGAGSDVFPNDTGIAQGASTILSGLAGQGDGNMLDLAQTLSTLDWMLNRTQAKPDVINYSFGNGLTSCPDCPDWSGLAKVVDYVVNHYHILWVKSAGNGGYIEASTKSPYVSSMSVPADNYNGITVANMNPTLVVENAVEFNPERSKHVIRYTSGRGPTLNGRKKPDLSAPGNDTRTCAPDPEQYPFTYTKAMDYHDGYRLMGGTSSAAPHVGAAALLLQNAGITFPMAQKALLINSADAYTDSNEPGPDDPQYLYKGGHYPVAGTEWNRTYGWGYLNMQKAYEERANLIQDTLTLMNPEKTYEVDLPVGAKITLIHERRVGYSYSREWRLSHLSLEIIEQNTHRVIMRDESSQDTVHQVAHCQRNPGETLCSAETKPMHVLVKVKLLGSYIDGAKEEPFVLASSVPLQ